MPILRCESLHLPTRPQLYTLRMHSFSMHISTSIWRHCTYTHLLLSNMWLSLSSRFVSIYVCGCPLKGVQLHIGWYVFCIKDPGTNEWFIGDRRTFEVSRMVSPPFNFSWSVVEWPEPDKPTYVSINAGHTSYWEIVFLCNASLLWLQRNEMVFVRLRYLLYSSRTCAYPHLLRYILVCVWIAFTSIYSGCKYNWNGRIIREHNRFKMLSSIFA